MAKRVAATMGWAALCVALAGAAHADPAGRARRQVTTFEQPLAQPPPPAPTQGPNPLAFLGQLLPQPQAQQYQPQQYQPQYQPQQPQQYQQPPLGNVLGLLNQLNPQLAAGALQNTTSGLAQGAAGAFQAGQVSAQASELYRAAQESAAKTAERAQQSAKELGQSLQEARERVATALNNLNQSIRGLATTAANGANPNQLLGGAGAPGPNSFADSLAGILQPKPSAEQQLADGIAKQLSNPQ